MNPQKLLLTAQEASEVLGIHPDEVYRMGAAGLIPSVKIGKRRRFPLAALNRWIDDNTSGGAQ